MEYVKNELVIDRLVTAEKLDFFMQYFEEQIKSSTLLLEENPPTIYISLYIYDAVMDKNMMDIDIECCFEDIDIDNQLTHTVIYYDEFDDKEEGLSKASEASVEIVKSITDELNAYNLSFPVKIVVKNHIAELPM